MELVMIESCVPLNDSDLQALGDSSNSKEIDTPQVGMHFSSEEEARDFYKMYAQGLGFGISKMYSKKGDDGQQKYISFGCSKNGKSVQRGKDSFYPRPCSKTDCKARINITVQDDGLFLITSIHLEHNHALSPRKSRHFRCNKERWRKDIKCRYQGITNIYDDSYYHEEERQRYNNLQPLIQEVHQLGSKNPERFSILMGILKDAKQRLMDINIVDSLDDDHDSNTIHGESRIENKKFHTPLKVRSCGRLPTKRKQSKVEQIVKKTATKSRNQAKGVRGGSKEKEDLSNF